MTKLRCKMQSKCQQLIGSMRAWFLYTDALSPPLHKIPRVYHRLRMSSECLCSSMTVQESGPILSQPNPKGFTEQVADSAASLQERKKRQTLKSLSEKADLAASLKVAPFDMNEGDTPTESDLPSQQCHLIRTRMTDYKTQMRSRYFVSSTECFSCLDLCKAVSMGESDRTSE